MRFNDFEIRKCKDSNNYELVKWLSNNNEKEVCIVVAMIRWNNKEPCWCFDSVGMRFVEYYETGLCEYIKAFMNLVDVIKTYTEEEGE